MHSQGRSGCRNLATAALTLILAAGFSTAGYAGAITGASTGEGESIGLTLVPIIPGANVTITSGPLPVASGTAPGAYNVSNSAASVSVLGVLSTGILNVAASSNVTGNVDAPGFAQSSAVVNALSLNILSLLGISAATISTSANVSGGYGALVATGGTTIENLVIAGLGAFGATITPSANDVVLNVLGVTITLNKQTITGDGTSNLSMITDGIDIEFNNAIAIINGVTGDLIGAIDIGISEASLTAIPDSVPEPSSLAGIVTGLGMLAFLRRHRQRT